MAASATSRHRRRHPARKTATAQPARRNTHSSPHISAFDDPLMRDLRVSQKLFDVILNQIIDEVIIIRRDGRIVFVNDAVLRNTGYKRQYVLTTSIIKFFRMRLTLDQWQRERFDWIKGQGGPVTYQLDRLLKNGQPQTVELTSSYVPYNSHEYLLCFFRNITKQVQLQAKLKETEDRYRLLSDQAVDGVITLDLRGHIVYANRAAEQMVQIPIVHSRGSHISKYIAESSLATALGLLDQARKGIPVKDAEIDVITKKGDVVPVEVTASPNYRKGHVFQVHVIVRDIARRKKMEALVRESEKMEALQHFVCGTTQELQGPLHGLYERAQSLLDKYKDRNFEYIGFNEFKDIMKTFEVMRDKIKYCYHITNNLIAAHRRKAGISGKSCNPCDMLHQVAESMSHSLAAAGIVLTVKCNPQMPLAAIGPVEMHQIVTNILTNAIQAIPASGGAIRLRAIYIKNADHVIVECQDTGVGIPKEILPRVVEPFFTTKQRGIEKSTGLGLSIVYSLLKAVKGDIEIDSNLRKGTTVRLLLPLYRRPKRKVSA